MLVRVQKLEAARAVLKSPIEVAYGSMDAFAIKVQVDVVAGKLDRTDAPVLVASLRRWHADRVWAGWRYHRNGMSEYGAQ